MLNEPHVVVALADTLRPILLLGFVVGMFGVAGVAVLVGRRRLDQAQGRALSNETGVAKGAARASDTTIDSDWLAQTRAEVDEKPKQSWADLILGPGALHDDAGESPTAPPEIVAWQASAEASAPPSGPVARAFESETGGSAEFGVPTQEDRVDPSVAASTYSPSTPPQMPPVRPVPTTPAPPIAPAPVSPFPTAGPSAGAPVTPTAPRPGRHRGDAPPAPPLPPSTSSFIVDDFLDEES